MLILYTLLAIIAFAGNSVLTRAALDTTSIDAATFTAVRLFSGAAVLLLLVRLRGSPTTPCASYGSWRAAIMLFVYAIAFSYAYISLPTSTGALILFAAVQLTMVGVGIWRGNRLRGVEWAGMTLAFAGLVYLVAPALEVPSSLLGVLLMLGSGIAWGLYSINGRGSVSPLQDTAWNFTRSLPFVIVMLAVAWPTLTLSSTGLLLAIASGALTSGLGYAIWYQVLPRLSITTAAVSQLSVPVVAAVGGVLFVGELVSLRLLIASALVLGGIMLAVAARRSQS
ncbi:DMT family transporter [Aliidiomarina sp. Khilg15.8]